MEKRRRERLEKESGSLRDRTVAKTEEDLKKVKEELETLRSEHKGLACLFVLPKHQIVYVDCLSFLLHTYFLWLTWNATVFSYWGLLVDPKRTDSDEIKYFSKVSFFVRLVLSPQSST